MQCIRGTKCYRWGYTDNVPIITRYEKKLKKAMKQDSTWYMTVIKQNEMHRDEIRKKTGGYMHKWWIRFNYWEK